MTILSDRLRDLTKLPIGWDGYQGIPVTLDNALFAQKLINSLCTNGIPVPSIVPGSDGTLQIEWHRGGFDIEIDILGVDKIDAYRLNLKTKQEEELENPQLEVISKWLMEMEHSCNSPLI